jgi:hypothetical protein
VCGRGGSGAGGRRRAGPPVHPGPDRLGARGRTGPDDPARGRRRATVACRRAGRLSVPPPLPGGGRRLRVGGSRARPHPRRSSRGLPARALGPPAERLRPATVSRRESPGRDVRRAP